MATVPALVHTGYPGVSVTIWYNDVNNRIGNVEWVIPGGLDVEVDVWIWNTDINPEIPIYENLGITASGEEVVPENHLMVEVTDDAGTYMRPPLYLLWKFHFRELSA